MSRSIAVSGRSCAAAVTLLATSLLGSAGALAQSNCQWYAATSLRQQQQNEKLKCGFAGAEWNSDMARHLAWCGSVPPDVWRQSAQMRDKMLAACAAKAR